MLRWVTPAELPGLSALHASEGEHQRHVYACVVGTEHLVAHAEAPARPPHPAHAALARHEETRFDRSHYYANPHEYVPTLLPPTRTLIRARSLTRALTVTLTLTPTLAPALTVTLRPPLTR